MKMKKFFSFVCCLFLAVSCFAPCAFANYPHDGEWIYLTLKSRPNLRLSLPSAEIHATTVGISTTVDRWSCNGCVARICESNGFTTIFRAERYGDGSYRLLLRKPFSLFGVVNDLALDEGPDSSSVHGWESHSPCNPGDNQRWIFEPVDPRDPHPILFRLRNQCTGRYATYNPPDNGVWGFHRIDSDDQIWIKH